jgi:transmembrane sensor
MPNDRLDSYWEIGALLAKYPDLSPEEQAVFNAWLKQEGHEALWKELKEPAYMQQRLAEWATLEEKKRLYREKLYTKIGVVVPFRKRRMMWVWYAAAASIILILSIGYLWMYKDTKKETAAITPQPVQPAVAPGSFKARLTLSDGRIIYLDSAALGKLATQGNTNIENKDGQLVYDPGKTNGDNNKVLYNTLTTGKGESYSVLLADGTQIWLNAASSITYPLSFPGNDRKVQITGEAYFDVQKNAAKPFIVQMGGTEVKVLGTEFNVNAYPEEANITATLIKGKIQLTQGTKTTQLIPGQQAVSAGGDITLIPDADLEKATGWKKGLFVFKGDNVQTIMKQIARWYDVKIEYRGAIAADRFYGMLSRDQPLNTVLEVLEKNNIHFRLQDRTIIVSP